ncbi:P1 family peptidase [Flexivirga alba]|uniref:P1 family peptidase n=1 Tax=Flexivirga alba TaxID=702742 RepID=A0ABW2ADN2_9MICO
MTIPIDGLKVGHWTDMDARTGCTAIEFPPGTVASYECRGGAPASRELLLMEPDKSVTSIDALLLTGGSAFGLAAADGVMRRMEELGSGVPTPPEPCRSCRRLRSSTWPSVTGRSAPAPSRVCRSGRCHH